MTSVSGVSLVGAIGCVGINESVVAREVGMRGREAQWVFQWFSVFCIVLKPL